mmetsp:Transcript_3542/g.8574  ORF Transcript_3542/g.8574 Transcript_3542/m.8574 type:complete len:83 (-) Transcript_3542:324-572(-)
MRRTQSPVRGADAQSSSIVLVMYQSPSQRTLIFAMSMKPGMAHVIEAEHFCADDTEGEHCCPWMVVRTASLKRYANPARNEI